MVAEMNYGNLAGTFVLLLILAALITPFTNVVTGIQNYTTGVSSQMAALILPVVLLLIAQNLWSTDKTR